MGQITRPTVKQKIEGGWLTDNEQKQLCFFYIKHTHPEKTAEEIDKDLINRGDIVWRELLNEIG